MSFHRISYLESWRHNPGVFRGQQPSPTDSHEEDEEDDEDTYQDLLDESISSSFPSTFSCPPLSHRLSFNPVARPGWNESTTEDTAPARDHRPSVAAETGPRELTLEGPELPLPETKGAFEIGRRKRVVQVCTAVIYCFLAAGTVFGFAAIKPIFIKEGVYRNLCSQDEINKDVSVCYGQELRLNLMFTVAAVATNVAALPIGTILDFYGPRVCGITGSCFLATGSFLLYCAPYIYRAFDAYTTGYFFLALGGPFIYISSFHLSNAFPARSSFILSMITGAFDASSALFLFFRLLNEKTNGSFSVQRFFLVYSFVPLFIIIVQLAIMPSTSYKTVGELVLEAESHIAAEATDVINHDIPDRVESQRQRNDRHTHRQEVVGKIQNLLSVADSGEQITSTIQRNTTILNHPHPTATRANTTTNTANHNTQRGNHGNDIRGLLHGHTALTQIRTPWFILITLFTVLQMLRINYFVATIRPQYTYLLSSSVLAAHLNHIFDIILPLGGIVCIPFIGTVLTSPRISTTTILATLVLAATLIGFLGCIPHSLPAAYVNIALFVVYRPFYYTAVSDYAAKVFGFQTFGKVYGLMVCLAGVGNFAQAGLDILTYRGFRGNPVPGNLVLTGLGALVGGALVVFVWQKLRHRSGDVKEGDELAGCWVSRYRQDGVESGGWEGAEQEPLLRGGIGREQYGST